MMRMIDCNWSKVKSGLVLHGRVRSGVVKFGIVRYGLTSFIIFRVNPHWFRTKCLKLEGWKVYRLGYELINDPERLSARVSEILLK